MKTHTLTDQCGTGNPLNPSPSVDSDGKSGMTIDRIYSRLLERFYSEGWNHLWGSKEELDLLEHVEREGNIV